MKHTKLFEEFINENKDEVIFSVDDEKLDQILHSKFGRKLDYEDVKGDSYYSLPKREFDQFIDFADSSGFDVDYDESEASIIYVYESRVFEDFVNEVSKQMISGTSGRTITTLDNRKYELKKDVKDARIDDFVNVVLPKGTIITNLPGGVFANHKDLKDKYCTGYKAQRWDDKFGVAIRMMPDTLEAIEDNSKVLESFEDFVNESALDLPIGMEQFQKDEREEGRPSDIYLATFSGKTFKAQSTDKTWDDGVPVTKNFTRGGYKDVKIKGQHYIIEGVTFWYFRIDRVWYAVKRADYGTPPFEY